MGERRLMRDPISDAASCSSCISYYSVASSTLGKLVLVEIRIGALYYRVHCN